MKLWRLMISDTMIAYMTYVDPLPMTATRLLVKSMLESHWVVWKVVPEKFANSLGMFGTRRGPRPANLRHGKWLLLTIFYFSCMDPLNITQNQSSRNKYRFRFRRQNAIQGTIVVGFQSIPLLSPRSWIKFAGLDCTFRQLHEDTLGSLLVRCSVESKL